MVAESVLRTLPDRIQKKQDAFSHTGGLHASALFDKEGSILSLYEDVGRHNALDKLIGRELQKNDLPLLEYGLILSGRTSFELIHKAALAGIPIVVSIGAPSSLAIEAAWEYEEDIIKFMESNENCFQAELGELARDPNANPMFDHWSKNYKPHEYPEV